MSDELIEIPSGWSTTTLGQVTAKLVDGSHNPPSKQKDGFPMLSARNIESEHIIFNDYRLIEQTAFETEDARTQVRPGDVLLTIVGAIGRAATVPENIKPFTLQRSVAVLSPVGMTSNFLMYQLHSPQVQQQLIKEAKGTAQKGIYLKTLSGIEMLIPPLNEQRRIVAKIEALRARSQRVKEALEAIPPLLDQFRQSVLAAAFRGDLTADWREQNPDVEPASVLLERICKERRHCWEETELKRLKAKGEFPKNERWKAKYQVPLPVNQEDFPELPEGWHWIKVEELVSDIPRSIQSGPFGSNLLHSEFQDTGILAIGIDNVLQGNFTLGSEHRISIEKYKELEKYTARPLDVLITVMATVGRCCVVPPDLETAIITKHVYRLSPERDLINPYFLMNALRGCDEVLHQIYRKIRGQTRPGINGQILRGLAIPVPPRLEQEQTLVKISNHSDSIEQVSKVLNELSISTSLLDQSILAKAFRGELVPQDLDDEPASVLLERIRAERAKKEAEAKAAKTKGKTRGRRRAESSADQFEQINLPGLE